VEEVEEIGRLFELHPLVLEDILHTGQRPKIDDYEDYLFITLRMLHGVDGVEQIESEQVSLVLGPSFVISFQERPGDLFELVRDRIRKGRGRIRKQGADYLTYALMDAIVDHYFIILEKIGEEVEQLEFQIIESPDPELMERVHSMKRELIFLRRSLWPLREVLSLLGKGEFPLIEEKTMIFFRDVHDHTIQVLETLETCRDMVSGMQDIYLSSMSNRLNEVMKILTVIATLFIPLSFITGLYGMNFKYMPELEWPWGYPLALLVMAVVAAVMLLWFKHKKLL
jgi:magnesium transporter